MAPIVAEHTDQRRRPRTGVYPGTFDPIHNGHLDIIRRATPFDVAEDERVVTVVRLVGAAEPNEPELNGPALNALGDGGDPNEPEPFRLNEPGGGDPNEPESHVGIGPPPDGADHG